VLVVDDVMLNLDVAKGMLKPYLMKIDCVSSGQQAVDAIRNEKVKYNAIFMDQMMPIMDGIEAVRIIREDIGTEYARTIPIIAFTANALAGNEEMFLSKGFQAFLTKPIDYDRLNTIIMECIRDEEQEKLYQPQKITIDGETFFDPRTGNDRRSGGDRRRGFDRRLFEEGIEGMDIRNGLERFNNNREVFLQILRSFAMNTRLLLETVKEVNENNLVDYAINVHGIKSSCRGICAEETGNQAEALEMAAKVENLDYVNAHNAPFIEAVLKLIQNVEAFLARGETKNDKPKKDKPYREALIKLQAACDKYQAEEIDIAMIEIDAFEYIADDGLVFWLKENVNKMNYMEIVEKISGLI
jgi:CheY-like chemotaxis protein